MIALTNRQEYVARMALIPIEYIGSKPFYFVTTMDARLFHIAEIRRVTPANDCLARPYKSFIKAISQAVNMM